MIMRHLKNTYWLALVVMMPSVLAAPVATPQDLPSDLTSEQIRQANDLYTTQTTQSTTQPSRHFTAEEVIQQPDLLENAFNTAVERQNIEHIKLLLPLYRRLPEQRQNKELAQYAQAILYRADAQHGKAENELRRILEAYPEYTPVRLQLAITQAEDGQQGEAAKELKNIKQAPDLPEHVVNYVNQFDQYLQQEKKWKWNANASYLQDDNVGRAPEQRSYAGWQFSEPKSAHGIGYELATQKTMPIQGHWATRVQASVAGKFYWDAHDYDDLNVHTEVGTVWRDAKQETSLSPFYDKRWFATEPYSQTAGAIWRYSRNLSPKISTFAAWQSGYKKHKTRRYLDGATHAGSLTLLYRPSAKQFLTVGVGGGRSNARDLSEAYHYGNLHAGWSQRWGQSQAFTTTFNASVQHRDYRAADFFNIQRRDTEYWTRLSLSHRKWSWRGFEPRLNWTWSHVKSNHFYYRYNQHRVFVDVAKSF